MIAIILEELIPIANKMISVNDLTPGLILSDAVITPNGKTLLGKGSTISQRTISLLSMWDVNYVFINIEDDQDPPTQEAAQPKAAPSSFFVSPECIQFLQEYDSITTSAENSFDFVSSKNKVPILSLKDTSFAIYSSILTTGPALMDYLLINDFQLATKISHHTVMVSYICGIIGRQLHFNEEEMKALTLAGLLHDIGRMVVSSDNLPEPQSHTINGAKLLKSVKGIPDEIILSVLQHHEYLDGTGAPMGVDGSKIHKYAKIIAIANIFHNNSYREECCNPFTALNILSNEMFGKLDPSICQLFTQQVRDSLVNCNVILSDNREATIIFFPASNSNTPIVRTTDEKLIDLSTEKDITILRMCTPDYVPMI